PVTCAVGAVAEDAAGGEPAGCALEAGAADGGGLAAALSDDAGAVAAGGVPPHESPIESAAAHPTANRRERRVRWKEYNLLTDEPPEATLNRTSTEMKRERASGDRNPHCAIVAHPKSTSMLPVLPTPTAACAASHEAGQSNTFVGIASLS